MAGSVTRRRFLADCARGGALALGSVAGVGCAPSVEEAEVGDRPRPLGVALVGLGYYASELLAPALEVTERCRLVGVVTGSPAKAERWRRRWRLAESCLYNYETMHRLADNPDIDVVYIVTPPGLHAEHAVRAAEAGKHVICEKPMARTVAECDAILAACQRAGVGLQVGYRLHYHAAMQELGRMAREQVLGAPLSMSGGFGYPAGEKTWRMTQTLGGGGPLMDVGIYVIQAACQMAGCAPVAVTAREEPKTRPDIFDEVEETLHFTLEFPDGAQGTFETSFSRASGSFRTEGPNGFVELNPAFNYNGVRGRSHLGNLEIPDINQQAAQMDGFAADVLARREPVASGAMGRRDMAIIEAIYAAARGGERVSVPR